MAISEAEVPGQVTLFVNRSKTADDDQAIKLIDRQFNGRVHLVERHHREDVLPSLWIDRLCYSGLSEIRRFLEIVETIGKPAPID
jgi:hypothetical protein